ncbi:APC family permease [Georgenia sp. MJ206]|uniref:APC family permease n=1 Tax=Georgenia wangjunii TaxID=3117730 RepID=UPI002F2688B7
MPSVAEAVKRVLVGRPVRSERLAAPALPKRLALPAFSANALSSVAYAPDEILLTLAVAGMAGLVVAPWVGVAVVVVLLTVVASYRQTVRAYPSGGGDYEVARANLGPRAGTAVASALLVDYVLTVAVSISAAAQYVTAVTPALDGRAVGVAVALIGVLVLVNLRGVRPSRRSFAVPVYLYMGLIGATAVAGFLQHLAGTLASAESAGTELVAADHLDSGLTGLAGAVLVLRAFSSGCAALTGIEALSTRVPAFARPRARNASATLLLLGVIASVMLLAVLVLARATGVTLSGTGVGDAADATGGGEAAGAAAGPETDPPVIGQVAEAVFAEAPVMALAIMAVTAVVLVLAANTAFTVFPGLASALGKDNLLPRQLHARGDRLVFSNGILTLGAAALVLVVALDASVTRLIQLYIVGVFLSFTLSQLGMVRHWGEELRTCADPAQRTQMARSRVISALGLGMTALVLAVVLITRFAHGAWVALALMAIAYVTMRGIHRHYARVSASLVLHDPHAARALPAQVHAVVLVSGVHQAALRAVAYARATRPSTLEAITVAVDRDTTDMLRRAWEEVDLPVPLTVLDSPFREVTRPVLDHVRSIRRDSPRDLVVVFIPEYVVHRWWERFLHNRSAARLRTRLLQTPGVVISTVPWQSVPDRTHGH